MPTLTPCPLERASSGERPTETISGSVKQTAGMATLSNARFCPAMISATISPCAIALCSSMGSPVTSPTAQTLRMDVRHWSSISMAEPFIVRSSSSSPKPVMPRAPADGDEIIVGSKACLVAIGELDPQRARRIKPARLGPEQYLDAHAAHVAPPAAGSARHRTAADMRSERLDQRHLGAELAIGDAELEPDVAARRPPAAGRARSRTTSASVEETMRPPKGSEGRGTASEPVAMTTCSAVMTCWPVSLSHHAGLAVAK